MYHRRLESDIRVSGEEESLIDNRSFAPNPQAVDEFLARILDLFYLDDGHLNDLDAFVLNESMGCLAVDGVESLGLLLGCLHFILLGEILDFLLLLSLLILDIADVLSNFLVLLLMLLVDVSF